MSYYPDQIRELKASINNLISTATKLRTTNMALRKRIRKIREEIRDQKAIIKGRKKK